MRLGQKQERWGVMSVNSNQVSFAGEREAASRERERVVGDEVTDHHSHVK